MLKIEIPIDELAEKLSIAGFEVESLDDLSKNAEGVVVGYVVDKEAHPNADKLSVCQVNVGSKTNLQIVCGAKNVKEGAYVAVATEGSVLRAKGIKIKASKLRGISSQGMICSLEELGLKSEQDGIYIFDSITEVGDLIGKSVNGLLGLDETVIELAITANRPDGMSVRGIAQEIAALTKERLKLPNFESMCEYSELKSENFKCDALSKNCIYGIALIELGDIAKYPNDKVKDRIEKCGINSVNPIVDITNYVMLEQGQPLHAFDADLLDKLIGRTVKEDDFGLRLAKESETFKTLDASEVSLNEDSTVVTCADIPIAVAGVIGGKDTAVSQKTKRIWLESAVFSQKSVRNSSRSLGIRTESSARYEKGITKEFTLNSAQRVISLIGQCEKDIETMGWYIGNNQKEILTVGLRQKRVTKLLGLISSTKEDIEQSKEKSNDLKINIIPNRDRELTNEEIELALNAIGCKTFPSEEGWDVEIPDIRKNDLKREIDLIEEVARIIGYDRFCSRLPEPINPGQLNSRLKAERRLRDALCSKGLNEITTFSLVPKDEDNYKQIPIRNPLLTETSNLRTNLWEEHLKICERNLQSGKKYCWIFEIGKIYTNEKGKIEESSMLSGILCEKNRLERWSESAKSKFDYYKARGILASIFISLKLEIRDQPITSPIERYHPGRTSDLILEGRKIGIFGEVHPEMLDNLDLPRQTYIFELDLDKIIDSVTRKNKWLANFKEFSTKPFLERDLSIILPKKFLSVMVQDCIKKTGKSLLEKVEIIDRYYSDSIGEENYGLTFRLSFRDKENILSDKDVSPIYDKICNSVSREFRAQLRV